MDQGEIGFIDPAGAVSLGGQGWQCVVEWVESYKAILLAKLLQVLAVCNSIRAEDVKACEVDGCHEDVVCVASEGARSYYRNSRCSLLSGMMSCRLVG